MNAEIDRLARKRPDLAGEYERYRTELDLMRKLVLNGPFPGLGSGDPDLSEVFAWRITQLTRSGGRIGVVLPRSILMSAGTDQWRHYLFENFSVDRVVSIVNNGQWMFENVHPQYTIALLIASRSTEPSDVIHLLPSRSANTR